MARIRGESGQGTWTVIVKDTKPNEYNGTWTDFHLKLWGESIDPKLATLLPMPTEEDDDDHDVIQTTTIPPTTVTPPPGFLTTGELPTATPTDHPDRPTKPKPSGTDTVSTGEEEASPQTTGTTSSWLPGFLPTFGASTTAQAWIYGSLGLIIVFCSGLGIYLYMARRRRLRNSPRDDYEFELLNEEEAEGLASGEKNARAGAGGKRARRTRGGELYDAFAGGSDDEDEDRQAGGYHDRDDSRSSSSDLAAKEKRALGGDDDEEHHVLGSDSEDDEGDEREGLRQGRRS